MSTNLINVLEKFIISAESNNAKGPKVKVRTCMSH